MVGGSAASSVAGALVVAAAGGMDNGLGGGSASAQQQQQAGKKGILTSPEGESDFVALRGLINKNSSTKFFTDRCILQQSKNIIFQKDRARSEIEHI